MKIRCYRCREKFEGKRGVGNLCAQCAAVGRVFCGTRPRIAAGGSPAAMEAESAAPTIRRSACPEAVPGGGKPNGEPPGTVTLEQLG